MYNKARTPNIIGVTSEREEHMNEALKAARDASGKTQAWVAEKVGISLQMYQRYEYNQNEPSVRTAIRIADVLGVKSYQDFKEIFS